MACTHSARANKVVREAFDNGLVPGFKGYPDIRSEVKYGEGTRIDLLLEGDAGAVYVHVGMYAFRMEALKRFVHLGPSRLEKIEKLEQLRLLENDIAIHVVLTEQTSANVDRPEDIAVVTRMLTEEKQAAAAGGTSHK